MDIAVKHLAILGCTGSIGRQTLDVVRALGGRFRVVALAGGRNVNLLAQQVQEFRPLLVWALEPSLPSLAASWGCQVASMEEMAQDPKVDLVVVATSGKAGLSPTLAALQARRAVALVNKEVLVMAGELVTSLAKSQGVELRPIDSEHSAIWQCLRGEGAHGEEAKVRRILLTASGGAFRDYTVEQMAQATPQEALKHPTWLMGKKVTVDSATLMNKGLEVIEAHWLFGVPYDQIEVVLHRESIIHSMVEFTDGSIKAQLSPPDMRIAIQYALTCPERVPNPELPRLDFDQPLSFTFGQVNMGRFPCLRLAREAGERGGTYGAVLSAADEVAVERFLAEDIGFLDIPRLVEHVLAQHRSVEHPSLADVLQADAWARESAQAWKARWIAPVTVS